MKFAIISVTAEGRKLSEQILFNLKNDPTVIAVDVFHKNVKNTLNAKFYDYDCWIGIMASGIMVRSICPLIKSKTDDPAVLVAGENSKHVISLLSGHGGGANHLAVKLAGIIGAIPVLTTATDLQGKMGIDTMAYQYWLETNNSSLVKKMNQHLTEDGKIDLFLPPIFRFLENHPLINRSYQINSWDELFIRASLAGEDLDMYPKRMVAGVGSKKGVTEEQVFFAIRSALQHLHIPLDRLNALATAEIKKHEDGIKLAAVKSGLPLEIVSLEEINGLNHPECTPSNLAEREFGIQGVSEPAALIAAGTQSRLVLRRTAFNGVTVAVAVKTN
jgi:cobalt-precorrin 5A hydrolase